MNVYHDHRNVLVLLKQQGERPEKFRPERGFYPVLFHAGAVLHQLSYQANWFQVVMWVDCKAFQSAFQIHENSLYYHHQ